MSEGKPSNSTFFDGVYKVVQSVPRGYVATYGQVAALAGHPHSARYVGFALHSNPSPGIIPCHRVVFRDGSLSPGYAFGGPERQKDLLEAEGVVFRSSASASNAGWQGLVVDLDICQWQS